MTETLRDQQRRVARERIFEAAAVEIVETGLMNLSIQAVADRAGVSHRTVYNYFENKERLVEELGSHVTEEMTRAGGVDLPDDLDRLPESIRTNWALFDAAGVKSEALARIITEQVAEGGGFSDDPTSRRRTEALRGALERLRPDLTPEQVDGLTALVRIHVSFHAWYRLTHEFGVNTDTAGALTAWAFRVMRDALARGEGPFD